MKHSLVIIGLLIASMAQAQLRVSIGKTDFSDWTNVSQVSNHESVIKYAMPKNANELVVELIDRRVQEVTISELESENKQTKVSVRELLNGKVIPEEHTK